jgi:hypothetical protein
MYQQQTSLNTGCYPHSASRSSAQFRSTVRPLKVRAVLHSFCALPFWVSCYVAPHRNLVRYVGLNLAGAVDVRWLPPSAVTSLMLWRVR